VIPAVVLEVFCVFLSISTQITRPRQFPSISLHIHYSMIIRYYSTACNSRYKTFDHEVPRLTKYLGLSRGSVIPGGKGVLNGIFADSVSKLYGQRFHKTFGNKLNDF
jgi:hypothetical protein